MKKINGFDLIEALGEVEEGLLDYPSAATYRIKRSGFFSAAAMLVISLCAVIVLYASAVIVGGSFPELNGGMDEPIGGDSMDRVEDGTAGSANGPMADITGTVEEIKISSSGALINFTGESGIINKREDGSITVTVVIGESGFIPEARIPYPDSDSALEILAPTIKNGVAIFTLNSAAESMEIYSEDFPYTVELIFSDSKDFVTFIYKTK